MMNLEKKLQELPPEKRQEVIDFVEFLLMKYDKKLKQKPAFAWAGAIQDLKTQYTSVELQQQILEWRENPL